MPEAMQVSHTLPYITPVAAAQQVRWSSRLDLSGARYGIADIRVSTARQHRSGLGEEAQRQAIRQFCANESIQLLEPEFVEVQSGKGADALARRPKLAAAFAFAEQAARSIEAAMDRAGRKSRRLPVQARVPIIVARLDRLARDVTFISQLMTNKIPFFSAELGIDAEDFFVHIFASVHEYERQLISKRTREALAAARAKGTKLGSHNPQIGSAVGTAALRRAADEHAARVRPIIEEIQRSGITKPEAIAVALNARGIPTARGGKWWGQTVINLMRRQVPVEPETAT